MAYHVEYTDEFEMWWNTLQEAEQISIASIVDLLEIGGPHLGYPHSSAINGSRHSHVRELRVQHAGDPYRILYAFDPRRSAILLLGGEKSGDDRWYKRFIPKADDLYDEHIRTLKDEGII